MPRATCGNLGRLLIPLCVLLAGWSSAARGQAIVRVNDDINFRLGTQLQTWAEWIQDPNSEGYSQNLYIRRIRAAILATIGPKLAIFYQTDNPNLGNSGVTGAKNFST